MRVVQEAPAADIADQYGGPPFQEGPRNQYHQQSEDDDGDGAQGQEIPARLGLPRRGESKVVNDEEFECRLPLPLHEEAGDMERPGWDVQDLTLSGLRSRGQGTRDMWSHRCRLIQRSSAGAADEYGREVPIGSHPGKIPAHAGDVASRNECAQ